MNAFKITLPEELLKEIDTVHEEIRNPICFYADKPTCVSAPWVTEPLTCSA